MEQRSKFGIIGYGNAGHRHRRIASMFGDVIWTHDPFIKEKAQPPGGNLLNEADYVVVAGPTHTHAAWVRKILYETSYTKIICEKPLFLPWEPLPATDRVNIVLQYRYADLAPLNPRKIVNTFIRDKGWWASWKGTPELSGGLIYMLHIHYIDLAIRYGCDYEGWVLSPEEGSQHRSVYGHDNHIPHPLPQDQDQLYSEVYKDVLAGGGIKPDDVRYLMYICDMLNSQQGELRDVHYSPGDILFEERDDYDANRITTTGAVDIGRAEGLLPSTSFDRCLACGRPYDPPQDSTGRPIGW